MLIPSSYCLVSLLFILIVPVDYRPPRHLHFTNTLIASFQCQMYLRIREFYVSKDVIFHQCMEHLIFAYLKI